MCDSGNLGLAILYISSLVPSMLCCSSKCYMCSIQGSSRREVEGGRTLILYIIDLLYYSSLFWSVEIKVGEEPGTTTMIVPDHVSMITMLGVS